MELDKRILPGKKPLTCFDTEQAQDFVGKKCYLTNDISTFANLDQFIEKEGCSNVTYAGVIDTLTNIGTEVSMIFETTYLRWKFCIPCEWVKEEKKEPKYRPYTIKDFEKAFLNGEFEDFIIFRDKHDPDNIFTMRYNGNFKKGDFEYICLGAKNYSFEQLFENYEVADYDGDWQPFGIEIQGEE